MSVVSRLIWEEETDQFWQQLIFPGEDRHLHTSQPWNGGYRWFRSPNVVCLEQYRRRRKQNNSEAE
jgi:hypothetical protein